MEGWHERHDVPGFRPDPPSPGCAGAPLSVDPRHGRGAMGILALWLAVTRLEFQSGHTDLISAGDRYRQLEGRDRLEFESVPGRVVVAIQGDDPEQAKAVRRRAGRALGA